MRSTPTLCVLIYGLTILAAACQQVGAEGLSVGGSCTNDFDCNYKCVRGEHYPGGMCTLDCNSPNDCPSKTTCVDDEGGICAVECESDGDCEDHGSEWGCVAIDQLGRSGAARVCRRSVEQNEGGSNEGGSNEGGAGGSGGS